MNHINRSNYNTEQDYRKAWIASFESQNRALVSGLIKRPTDNMKVKVSDLKEKDLPKIKAVQIQKAKACLATYPLATPEVLAKKTGLSLKFILDNRSEIQTENYC